jgi:hypothetical protein
VGEAHAATAALGALAGETYAKVDATRSAGHHEARRKSFATLADKWERWQSG